MKVYLAGAWSRQKEIKKIAGELTALGIEVTSRWLNEQDSRNPADVARHRRETAFIDIQDVRRADMLVRFTDDLTQATVNSRLISGARMFEFGLAWGAGIPVVVVGGLQNVFDYLPNVIHLADVAKLKKYLSSTEPE